MNNKYTLDYFIDKFEAIPDEQWCTEEYTDQYGRHCALGHCNAHIYGFEASALSQLLGSDVTGINDGWTKYVFLGKTPKERILNALKYLKKGKQI